MEWGRGGEEYECVCHSEEVLEERLFGYDPFHPGRVSPPLTFSCASSCSELSTEGLSLDEEDLRRDIEGIADTLFAFDHEKLTKILFGEDSSHISCSASPIPITSLSHPGLLEAILESLTC